MEQGKFRPAIPSYYAIEQYTDLRRLIEQNKKYIQYITQDRL